jgi:hypothetical protein
MSSQRKVTPQQLKEALKDKDDAMFDFARSDMKPDKLFVEARAKIFWGELFPSVLGFLTSNGIAAVEADSKIRGFQHQRNMEIRKLGVRSVLIGLLVGSLATFALYIFAWPIDRGSMALANAGIATIVFVALYGLWKIGIGFVYVIWPQSVRKSVTAIGESDIFEDFFDK